MTNQWNPGTKLSSRDEETRRNINGWSRDLCYEDQGHQSLNISTESGDEDLTKWSKSTVKISPELILACWCGELETCRKLSTTVWCPCWAQQRPDNMSHFHPGKVRKNEPRESEQTQSPVKEGHQPAQPGCWDITAVAQYDPAPQGTHLISTVTEGGRPRERKRGPYRSTSHNNPYHPR